MNENCLTFASKGGMQAMNHKKLHHVHESGSVFEFKVMLLTKFACIL